MRVRNRNSWRKREGKKVYEVYQTPFEAFLAHPGVSEFLKEGITIENLNSITYEKSDNECGALMQKAKVELFKNLSCHKFQFPTIRHNIISGSYLD